MLKKLYKVYPQSIPLEEPLNIVPPILSKKTHEILHAPAVWRASSDTFFVARTVSHYLCKSPESTLMSVIRECALFHISKADFTNNTMEELYVFGREPIVLLSSSGRSSCCRSVVTWETHTQDSRT